jgi:hypothetical protein
MILRVTINHSDGRPESTEAREATATAAWMYHALWCHVRTVKRAVVTNAL